MLLFAAAEYGQLTAQVIVTDTAGKLMGKPHVFKFSAVHQNYPGAGVGVRFLLAIRLWPEYLPVQKQMGVFVRSGHKWDSFSSLPDVSIDRQEWNYSSL